MGRRDDVTRPGRWEVLLKQGLDQMADLREEPPDLAQLQMLVAAVQAEQRRHLYADLVKFWLVAALMLSGLAVALLRQPLYFLLFQGGLVFLSLLGAGLWYTGQRRVTE